MKKKLLILAAHYRQYINVCHHLGINPYKDARYISEWNQMCGWWIDQPVILIEGYELNQNYTLELMYNIGCRFERIGYLSEGEIWNENP